LATFLAVALNDAGFSIAEIVARDSARSRRRARFLAEKVDARAVTADSAALNAGLLWFCVPDREIRSATLSLAGHVPARTSPRGRLLQKLMSVSLFTPAERCSAGNWDFCGRQASPLLPCTR
jgi:hypothetical protein